MKIHKEGYKIISIAIIVFTTLQVTVHLLLGYNFSIPSLIVFLLLTLFILRFFRVPKRNFTENYDKIISPADGEIVAIEEVEEDEFLKTRCIQVSVFMSVWNVHINWHPAGGKVIYYKYHPGKYLEAWNPKSSTLNERTTVAIERLDGEKILYRQIAGFLARRIVCNAVENATVSQGEEVGFIKFGSRVDVFLPLNALVRVKLGDKVTGTQTVLADLPMAKTE